MKPVMYFAWEGEKGFPESRDEAARLLRGWRRSKRLRLCRLAPYHYRVESGGTVAILCKYRGEQ